MLPLAVYRLVYPHHRVDTCICLKFLHFALFETVVNNYSVNELCSTIHLLPVPLPHTLMLTLIIRAFIV